MSFVANFIRFQTVQNFENRRLRFHKVRESLKVGTFLRQCVDSHGTDISSMGQVLMSRIATDRLTEGLDAKVRRGHKKWEQEI